MKQNKETVPPAGPVADSHITSQTGWLEEVAIHWTNVPGSTAYPGYSPNAREENCLKAVIVQSWTDNFTLLQASTTEKRTSRKLVNIQINQGQDGRGWTAGKAE